MPRPWHSPRSELRSGAFQLTRRVRFFHEVPKEHMSNVAMSHSLWPISRRSAGACHMMLVAGFSKMHGMLASMQAVMYLLLAL